MQKLKKKNEKNDKMGTNCNKPLKNLIIFNIFFFSLSLYSQEKRNYEQIALDWYVSNYYKQSESKYTVFNNSIELRESPMTNICFGDYMDEFLDKEEDSIFVNTNNYKLVADDKVKFRKKKSFFLNLFHKKRIKVLKVFNVVIFNNKIFVEVSLSGYSGSEYHCFDFEKSTGKVLRHCVTEYVR